MSTRDDEPGDSARAEAEELAWREIVDHYGEGPDLADLSDLTSPLDEPREQPLEYRVVRPIFDPEDADVFRDDLGEEPFVPPPLPPPPEITPERRVAWVGLVVSPVLLVLINLLDYALPGILTFGLVVAFIASFGYLVATMAPRDPDDDGARV